MNPRLSTKTHSERIYTKPATGASHRDRAKPSSAKMDCASETTKNAKDGGRNGEMLILEPEILDDKIILYLEYVTAEKGEIYVGMPSWEEPVSVFFSVTKPDIQTGLYIRRLVRYAQCSRSAFIIGLVYLKRLEANDNKLVLSPYNMHRLLITSLMLAAKIVDDRCYSNAHYARVGGIATVKEMNRLELQMLALLKYDLFVSPEEYDFFVRNLHDNKVLPNSPSAITRIHEYFPKQAQRSLLNNQGAASHPTGKKNFDQEDTPGSSSIRNGHNPPYHFDAPGSQLIILPPPKRKSIIHKFSNP